jgi:hypothetical protein
LLDPSPTTSAGVGKVLGRVIRSPPARAGRGAAAAEPVPVPDARLAVGLPAAALGGLCADNSAESVQHTITRITAKTKAVNPSHKTSPTSLGRLGPITGVASVAIIYLVPTEKRWRIR